MQEKSLQSTKDWLKRGWKLNQTLKGLEINLATLRSCPAPVTPQYGGDAVAGSRDPHKMENYVEALERYSQEIKGYIAELADVSSEILQVIRRVTDNQEQAVLINRYLNFFTWERIAVELSYSYMHVTRIHRRALKSVKEILEKEKML